MNVLKVLLADGEQAQRRLLSAEGSRCVFSEEVAPCFFHFTLSTTDERRRKNEDVEDRAPTMNDVAPPLYGSGLPAVVSAPHPQQQQQSDGTKLFELEPVREEEERETEIRRRRPPCK